MATNNHYKILTGIGFVVLMGVAATRRLSSPEVSYPEHFRAWAHVKTGVIEKNNPAFSHWGGFHHIYANDKAMEGYGSGNFPDGSVIVFDVLEAVEKDNYLAEGPRRIVDVMEKDAVRYAATGGWGFEEFKGNSKTERLVRDSAVTACYNCHTARK
ncbi:MAG TPA: cytochrome P460 family protein, partial [Puia sp.]|nr:cytochrome P460 family protein [Puia sp.]